MTRTVSLLERHYGTDVFGAEASTYASIIFAAIAYELVVIVY